MSDSGTSRITKPPLTSLGALLDSKGPPAWPSSAGIDRDAFGVVARAFGQLVYSGMPLYHAIALVEKARAQQYKTTEIVQVTEAVRKLLLLHIPPAHVCGIVGYLFKGDSKVPLNEAIAFLDVLREKVVRGVAPDRVYLEITSVRPPQ